MGKVISYSPYCGVFDSVLIKGMNDTPEKQAIRVIGSKVLNFLSENYALNQEISTRQEKLASNQSAISDCIVGLRVFGIDLNADGAWDRFMAEYAESILSLTSESQQPPQASRVEAIPTQPFISTNQPISVLLLDRLRDVGFHGSKALPLRNFLKEKYNIDTHYKTVGMSLYRLSQEEPPKVHRKGHTWFFGPPQEETKNPGADTPGQTSLLDSERSEDDA
jgi:hypothetical protein